MASGVAQGRQRLSRPIFGLPVAFSGRHIFEDDLYVRVNICVGLGVGLSLSVSDGLVVKNRFISPFVCRSSCRNVSACLLVGR